MKKKTGAKAKIGLAVGAGVAVAAAAATAAYLFSGKRGAANRKKVKAIAIRARKEIAAGVRKLKAINKASYHKVVDEAMRRYKRLKNIDQKEIAAIVGEAKSQWAKIQKHLAKRSAPKKAAKKKKRA